MASRSTCPNGDTWIFVKASNGKRRAIRLGKLTKEDAEEAERRIRKIEATHQGLDKLDRMTLLWLDELPRVLRERVVRTGIVPADVAAPPEVASVAGYSPHSPAPARVTVRDCSLETLIAKWRETLTVEPQSSVSYDQMVDRVRRFLAWLATRPLSEGEEPRNPLADVRQLRPADGNRFEAWLIEHGRKQSDKPLAASTASRTIGAAQTLFEFGVLEGWYLKSPFDHLTRRGEFNDERNVYVTARLIDKLVEISPDQELATALVLSRYATFRGPSEFAALAWSDVDWEASMIGITAPKTKRYRFGRRRRAPLNAKVLAQLNKLWDDTPGKAVKVLPRIGSLESSPLNERLELLCRRLGVALWDKPWTNMRASCETDWQQIDKMQPFETAAYMGHGATVALLHYNRVAKDRVADLPPALIDPSEGRRSTENGTIRGEARSEALG
jgi:integrase